MTNYILRLIREAKEINKDLEIELGKLSQIRNHIINYIFLISGIFGAIAVINTTISFVKTGWQIQFLIHYSMFVIVWGVYLFKNKISLNWKASIFIFFFSLLAISINYNYGIVSGALNFVFITTIVTLIFGWRAGALSIALTLIIRILIGLGYYNGILHNNYDLSEYALSLPAMFTNIMSGLVIASIIVFAINKFYQWLILSLKSITDKNKELSAINIELLKAKQQAEENDRLKSVFLANMSHEIRTPMNAIVGFSGVLSKPNLSDEKRDRYISIIHERSYDLLRIIEDILDISKIEVGQLKLINSEFYIKELFASIYDSYKLNRSKYGKNKEVELICYLPANIKKLKISLDKQRLNQIFTNLLDNAYKFTPKGNIEYGCKLNELTQLIFWVKDSGIGIPPEKHSIIFDRFRQADELNMETQVGGTGLGLSIVQGIIKLMNGKIWVESEVNIGTTFYFTLPTIITKEVENK